MSKYEQQGYDAYVELWTMDKRYPTASNCPARWMKDEDKRRQFIRGWKRAEEEARK